MAAELDKTRSFEALLAELSGCVGRDHPHLVDLFATYAREALFGRAWIDENLQRLHPGSTILEVGAGSMLLSCQLCREGFDVTAVEPVGEGFSSFAELQELVLNYMKERGIAPNLLPVAIEALVTDRKFDFAYSINVMEHVEDVPEALSRVVATLVPGGEYRFTCPNYLFPYEPHFNIPILFSKSVTARLFHDRIFMNQSMPDPAGVWRSLNWISVTQIKRAVRRLPDVSLYFKRTMLRDTLARLVTDEQFSARRSSWMRRVADWLVSSGVYRLAILVPVTMQPVTDCTLKRHEAEDNASPAS